ncbi:MAG TPA: hypothetical protein VF422_05535 [Dokdonella sp.]
MPQPTRKWVFLEQEARRLYALKLSERAIAKKLGVAKSTITRWKKAGKLGAGPDSPGSSKVTVLRAPTPRQSPAEWARAIRAEYKLDATDEQLVTGAETMLSQSRDMTLTASEQRRAFAEFRAIVRQLNLPGRQEAAPSVEQPAVAPEPVARPRLVTPPIVDPRAARMAVGS